MKKLTLYIFLSFSLLGDENYCSFVKENTDKKDKAYNHINILCDNMEKTANKIHDIYRSSNNLSLYKNVLMKDSDLLTTKNGTETYNFSTREDFRAVFTSLSEKEYKEILENIRTKEMRRRYVNALLNDIDKNYDRSKSDCISGGIVEGNQIIGIKNRGFITVEERGKIILRWYKDSDDCQVVKAEDDMEFGYSEFEGLGISLSP
ncbi:MAG: hypothetical protein OIF32_03900 [Campylobacterales bacterium]|nr:hypothetical protein [Campylobacterales bacterium]